MKALVTLANGDMRKALNILQVRFQGKYNLKDLLLIFPSFEIYIKV